ADGTRRARGDRAERPRRVSPPVAGPVPGGAGSAAGPGGRGADGRGADGARADPECPRGGGTVLADAVVSLRLVSLDAHPREPPRARARAPGRRTVPVYSLRRVGVAVRVGRDPALGLGVVPPTRPARPRGSPGA